MFALYSVVAKPGTLLANPRPVGPEAHAEALKPGWFQFATAAVGA